jgi:hypothetical protein
VVATTPWIELYLVTLVYPLIGGCSPWSNLCSTRQLFGGEEQTMSKSKINERCAGIDVGKRFLLCCVLTGAAQDEPRSQTLRFDATVSGPDPHARMADCGKRHARV